MAALTICVFVVDSSLAMVFNSYSNSKGKRNEIIKTPFCISILHYMKTLDLINDLL